MSTPALKDEQTEQAEPDVDSGAENPPAPESSSADAPSPQSKRRADRVDWNATIELCMATTGSPRPVCVKARNISALGFAFLSSSMVHAGSTGVALIQTTNGKHAIRGFEVAHCHYDMHMKAHIIGCQWTSDVPVFAQLFAVQKNRRWRLHVA